MLTKDSYTGFFFKEQIFVHTLYDNSRTLIIKSFLSLQGKINLWSFLPKTTNNVKSDRHTCIVTCIAITSDGKIAMSGKSFHSLYCCDGFSI